MAAAVKRRRTSYATYGNVAYAPGYEGGAVRSLPQEEVLVPRPKARPRRKAQVQARPKVRVREQDQVSVFAVVGFLAVAAFAALVILSYVRLAVVGNQTVQLRNEISSLQSEEAKLMARYELAYDFNSIEESLLADGTMVRPQSEQIFVLDLSEPDNVVLYQQEEKAAGIAGLRAGIQQIAASVLEYFQ